jgi:hypothetical protein
LEKNMTKRIVRPEETDRNCQPESEPGDAFEGNGQAVGDFDPAKLEAEAQATALNPFDPQTYMVGQNLAAAAGVDRILTDLPVRSAPNDTFVRIHPSDKYQFSPWVIDLKSEQETYLVQPPLYPALIGESTFKRKHIHLAVTKQSAHFLWAVRCPPDDDQPPDKWMKTPLEALRLAKNEWTRIYWDASTRQHRLGRSEDPQEPDWWVTKYTFPELLKIAFKDYIIDSLDHPVIRRLKGGPS